MKRMLINATQPEEIRVALVDGQKIYDLDIDNISKEQKKANIYIGTVRNLEPSLNAAFIDYGSERHGFLPVKEIAREYWQDPSNADDQNNTDSRNNNRRPNIKDILKVGQVVLVQVDKEERGNKGAALTTFISLAGCYLVLMPNNPRAGGISRRIDGDERDDLRETLQNLDVPESMGVIVRTAGVGRPDADLQWDLSVLLKRWEDILKAIESLSPPALIHQERDLIARAVRDHLRDDIGEIIIDNDDFYQKCREYVERLRPDMLSRVKPYTDKVPLFSRFQIESQIESATQREVVLPSGGSVVIDPTEALISIDINSARSTKGSDIEETALQTNLEAADEIARQLRLRDIGGLIVIDFIDMTPTSHQREVENRLREALRLDRARVQIGRISRFGLLEMSRQRLRSSLGESIHQPCPRCAGQGTIRGIESLSLSIIRLIEEEAMKDRTTEIHAALPIEVATYLVNEKRSMLIDLEARHTVRVLVLPVIEIQAPAYEIRRIRLEEEGTSSETTSYQKAQQMATQVVEQTVESPSTRPIETPAIQYLPTTERPAQPSVIAKALRGLFCMLKSLFATKKPKQNRNNSRRGRHDQGHRRSGSGSGSGQDRGRSRNHRRRNNENRDRGERNDRSDKKENQDNRRQNNNRDRNNAGRQQRNDRPERNDRNDRNTRSETTERTERTDRNDRPERTERNDRDERTDRPERNDRNARNDRGERKERGGRGPRRNNRDNPRNQQRRPENAEPSAHTAEMLSPVASHVTHEDPKPQAQPAVAVQAPAPAAPAPQEQKQEQKTVAPAAVTQEPKVVATTEPKPAPAPQTFKSPLMQETPLVDVTAANAGHAETENRPQQRRRANHLRPYAGNKQDNRESKPEPEKKED